jgi:hypothetical protein
MHQTEPPVLNIKMGRSSLGGKTATGGLLLLAVLAMLPGCRRMMASATTDLANNLSAAIANHDDPATVEAGGPAYLLMLDGLIHSDPRNEALLLKGASLYSTYASAFVDDPERARKLSSKALNYAERALCVHAPDDCDLRKIPFEAFQIRLQVAEREALPLFYTLGTTWAGWIQARKDDFEALAEISRVEAIMQRIIDLEEGYREGGAHVYMGVFAILVPPALGGQPEVARRHFERAIALSGGRNLMTKVIYAQQYARMVYDRELHDRLLNEVLAADPQVPGLVLENTLARKRARELMVEADAYF